MLFETKHTIYENEKVCIDYTIICDFCEETIKDTNPLRLSDFEGDRYIDVCKWCEQDKIHKRVG